LRFYLGTHEPSWLARTTEPLFIARKRLARLRGDLPVATCPWVLDSGGYSELNPKGPGRWTVTRDHYAAEVERYADQVGNLAWAAPMDYMCEPDVVAHTGLTVAEHQRRTTANFLDLRERCGMIIAPVLQGWTISDYQRHVAQYDAAGVWLDDEPVVAVGSVCRRGQDAEIHRIIRTLADYGLRLHAFGVRAPALGGIADVVHSADSLSWSYQARKRARAGELPDHPHPRGGVSCANCLTYAEQWRARTLANLERSILYQGAPA